MIFIKILKNTNKKRKIIIAFDNMIADMLSNKKLNPVVFRYFSCFYYAILLYCAKKY